MEIASPPGLTQQEVASLCATLRKKAQGSDHAVIQEKIKSLKRFSHPEDGFQFELLQNAIDAGATNIVILISATSFELRHNGKRFTSKDIEALSSTGLSAKGSGSIGMFGMGFKTVFKRFQRAKIAEEAWAITFDVPMIREFNRPGYLDWQGAFTPVFVPCSSTSLKNLTSCHLSMLRTEEPIKLATEEVFAQILAVVPKVTRLQVNDTTFTKHVDGEMVRVTSSAEKTWRWQVRDRSFRIEERDALDEQSLRLDNVVSQKDAAFDQLKTQQIVMLVEVDPKGMRGRAFAALPIEQAEVPVAVVVQGGWILELSRSNITNGPWNRALSKELGTLYASYLVEELERGRKHVTETCSNFRIALKLSTTQYSFQTGFISYFNNEQVRKRKWIPCTDGKLHSLSEDILALDVPEHLRFDVLLATKLLQPMNPGFARLMAILLPRRLDDFVKRLQSSTAFDDWQEAIDQNFQAEYLQEVVKSLGDLLPKDCGTFCFLFVAKVGWVSPRRACVIIRDDCGLIYRSQVPDRVTQLLAAKKGRTLIGEHYLIETARVMGLEALAIPSLERLATTPPDLIAVSLVAAEAGEPLTQVVSSSNTIVDATSATVDKPYRAQQTTTKIATIVSGSYWEAKRDATFWCRFFAKCKCGGLLTLTHHEQPCKPTSEERNKHGVIATAGALVWQDIPQSQLQGLSTTIDALIALDPSPFKCKVFHKHLTSKRTGERQYVTIEIEDELNLWVKQLQSLEWIPTSAPNTKLVKPSDVFPLDTSLPIHVIEFLERKQILFKDGSIHDEFNSITELGQTATLEQFKYSVQRFCNKVDGDAYFLVKHITIEQFLDDPSEVERSILHLVKADKIHPSLEQFLVLVDDLAPDLREFLRQVDILIPTDPSVDQLLAVLDDLHIYKDLENRKKRKITKHCLQSILNSGQSIPSCTILLLGQDNQFHKSSDLWIPCPKLDLADRKKYSSRFLHEKCWPESNDDRLVALATQLGLRTVKLVREVSEVQVENFPNLFFVTQSLTKFAHRNPTIKEFTVCFAKIQQVAILDGDRNSTRANVWIPSERDSINKGWPLYMDNTARSSKLRTALASELVEFYEIEETFDFKKMLKALLEQAFDPKVSMDRIIQGVEKFEEEFESMLTEETPQRLVRTKERITTSGPPPPPPDFFDSPAKREEARKSFPASPYQRKGYGIRDSDEESEEIDESDVSDEESGYYYWPPPGDISSEDERASSRTDGDKTSYRGTQDDRFSGVSSPSHGAPTQRNASPQSAPAPPQARSNSLDDTPPKPRGSVPTVETYQKMKEQGNAGEASAAKYLRDKYPLRQVIQNQDGSACDFTVVAPHITEYFEVKTKTTSAVKFEMSEGELTFAQTKKGVYSILFYPNFDAAASKEVGYSEKPIEIPGTDLFDKAKFQVVPTHYQVKKL